MAETFEVSTETAVAARKMVEKNSVVDLGRREKNRWPKFRMEVRPWDSTDSAPRERDGPAIISQISFLKWVHGGTKAEAARRKKSDRVASAERARWNPKTFHTATRGRVYTHTNIGLSPRWGRRRRGETRTTHTARHTRRRRRIRREAKKTIRFEGEFFFRFFRSNSTSVRGCSV